MSTGKNRRFFKFRASSLMGVRQVAASLGISVLLVATTLHPSAADAKDTDARIHAAVLEFCQQDARETANYLLTQGTPDDVALMEEAIYMLDTGEWQIVTDISDAVAQESSASSDGIWRVSAICTWKTPVADLNGSYDVDLEIDLKPDDRHDVRRLLP